MIQRIQTVYFILIAGLMLAMLFLPLGEASGDTGLVMKANGIFQRSGDLLYATWILYAFVILVALDALSAIFLYKNRPLQIKCSYVNCIQILLVYGLFFFYHYSFFSKEQYEYYETTMFITLAFPAVALILNFLAIRGIKKDEKLIKSLDRIR